MSEIERAKEYPSLKEKHMTRNDIIQGNINMLDSGAIECRKIGKLASAEEKEIIAEILRAELERGEWIAKGNDDDAGFSWVCSVCFNGLDDDDYKNADQFERCPYCGAHMKNGSAHMERSGER